MGLSITGPARQKELRPGKKWQYSYPPPAPGGRRPGVVPQQQASQGQRLADGLEAGADEVAGQDAEQDTSVHIKLR
jgi:hypothetical protein